MPKLADHQPLTQYGNAFHPPGKPFRSRPRMGKEMEVSLLAGKLSVHEAVARVMPRRAHAQPGDGVRHTTVETLRRAGFIVRATPTRRNSYHVSVLLDDSREWTDDVCQLFDACFDVPIWKEGDDE